MEANNFKGYISNLRVCKGHAVYKSNFTVPTRELDVHPGPDDDRTVLLVVMMERIFLQIRLEDISLQHMVIAQVLQHPQQLIVPLVLQQTIQDLIEM